MPKCVVFFFFCIYAIWCSLNLENQPSFRVFFPGFQLLICWIIQSCPQILKRLYLVCSFLFVFQLCNFYLSIFKFTDSFLGWVPTKGIYSSPALLTFPSDPLFRVPSWCCDYFGGFCMLPTLSIRAFNVFIIQSYFQHLCPTRLLFLFGWLLCLLGGFFPCFAYAS